MSNTFTALKQPLLTLTSNPQSLRATEKLQYFYFQKKRKKKPSKERVYSRSHSQTALSQSLKITPSFTQKQVVTSWLEVVTYQHFTTVRNMRTFLPPLLTVVNFEYTFYMCESAVARYSILQFTSIPSDLDTTFNSVLS